MQGSGRAARLTDVIPFLQEKLQEALKKLMKEQEESEKLKAGVQEEITSWKARGDLS